MAGPGGIGGSGYVEPKRLKQNWRFLLPVAVIFAIVLYFLFMR